MRGSVDLDADSSHRDRIDAFLAVSGNLRPPFAVVDLEAVAARYLALTSSLPGVAVRFAARTDPSMEVLELLARLGAGFEVHAATELDACLDAGIDPAAISFDATRALAGASARAQRLGVSRFTVSAASELQALAHRVPGATVALRTGHPAHPAVGGLLRRAARWGLRVGLAIDQGRGRPGWDAALSDAAVCHADLRAGGMEPAVLDLVGPLGETGVLRAALDDQLPPQPPPVVTVVVGRSLLAGTAVLRTSGVGRVAGPGSEDVRRQVDLWGPVIGKAQQHVPTYYLGIG
jgi:ornithine decarboxylase